MLSPLRGELSRVETCSGGGVKVRLGSPCRNHRLMAAMPSASKEGTHPGRCPRLQCAKAFGQGTSKIALPNWLGVESIRTHARIGVFLSGRYSSVINAFGFDPWLDLETYGID
jgi:hypothetical protein